MFGNFQFELLIKNENKKFILMQCSAFDLKVYEMLIIFK